MKFEFTWIELEFIWIKSDFILINLECKRLSTVNVNTNLTFILNILKDIAYNLWNTENGTQPYMRLTHYCLKPSSRKILRSNLR